MLFWMTPFFPSLPRRVQMYFGGDLLPLTCLLSPSLRKEAWMDRRIPPILDVCVYARACVCVCVCTNTVREVSTAWGKSCQRRRVGIRMSRSASQRVKKQISVPSCWTLHRVIIRHNSAFKRKPPGKDKRFYYSYRVSVSFSWTTGCWCVCVRMWIT